LGPSSAESAGSKVVAYPDDELDINPFNTTALWRDSLDDDRLPERVLRDMAARWVKRYSGHDDLSQAEWLSLGFAHQVREERIAARRAFERALARGGPLDDNVRTALRELGGRPGSPDELGP